ncbi:hypothetical protein MC885_000559 [Smutsia gigantea]|nr:hypothetical protein MC885_000559 [Smutsia gigantea]
MLRGPEASVLHGVCCSWLRNLSSVQTGGQGPAWSAVRQALQEAVEQELATLQQAWEPDGGRAQPCPHGPHRLVRSEAGVPGEQGGLGLQAAEVIGALRSREAYLEAVLRQLQGQCQQELARLAGALPGLIWITPPRQATEPLPAAGWAKGPPPAAAS